MNRVDYCNIDSDAVVFCYTDIKCRGSSAVVLLVQVDIVTFSNIKAVGYEDLM